jgi:hypothetical protein
MKTKCWEPAHAPHAGRQAQRLAVACEVRFAAAAQAQIASFEDASSYGDEAPSSGDASSAVASQRPRGGGRWAMGSSDVCTHGGGPGAACTRGGGRWAAAA